MTKHITEQETLYKKLVTNLICGKDISFKEKNFLLFNFLNQSEFYYDVFCDSVYLFMTNDSLETFSLDDSGYARFNFGKLDNCFVGLDLLVREDIVDSEEDIIIYINLALKRLERRLYDKSYSYGFVSNNRINNRNFI